MRTILRLLLYFFVDLFRGQDIFTDNNLCFLHLDREKLKMSPQTGTKEKTMNSGKDPKNLLPEILHKIEAAVAENDDGRVIRNLIKYQAISDQPEKRFFVRA